jgi:hypothetical protein
MGYLSSVPKELQRAGWRAGTAKRRTDEQLRVGIGEWVAKKYELPEKLRLMQLLAPGPWSRELVVHFVHHAPELELIREHGIVVHRLSDVVRELKGNSTSVVKHAAGADLVELVHLALDEDQSSRMAMPQEQ